VRHTIAVHDLRATELEVGSVDFATEQLVDGLRTGEDDWLAFNLDGTLTKANQVGTDTYKLLAANQSSQDVYAYQLSGKSPK